MRKLQCRLLGDPIDALMFKRRIQSDVPVYWCSEPQLAIGDYSRFQQSFGVLACHIPALLSRQEFTLEMSRLITHTYSELRYREQHPLITARKMRGLSRKKLAQLSGVPQRQLRAMELYSIPIERAQMGHILAALCLAPEHMHPVFRRRIVLRLSVPECNISAATMHSIVHRRASVDDKTIDALTNTLDMSVEELGFARIRAGLYAQRGLKHTVRRYNSDSPNGTGL